ncbi:MAG: ANTAR domain-containing protein [Acidimicrobiales bacterium]
MPSDRLMAIFTLLSDRKDTDLRANSLCAVAAEFTNLSGAGIALVSTGRQYTSLCTSNAVARKLMDLEFTVGEGPCVDACLSEFAVDEVDLITTNDRRWMAYAPSATDAGAHAVFGFPVRIGAIRLGALSLYRDRPGPLSPSQSSDAYLMASVIGRAVLAMQAGAPHESLSSELEREATFDFTVHQAAGMVAVQGSMTVGDALVALRAHAFATNTALSELAVRVVIRQTSFDPNFGAWRDDGVTNSE